MVKVHNSLDQSIRTGVVPLLQEALVHAVDLYTQVKQSHWTLRGPNFIGLHKLFDEVAEEPIPDHLLRLLQDLDRRGEK